MKKRMKKSMGKRVLSVLLAMAMCLSMGTIRAQAETGTQGEQIENVAQTSGLDFSNSTVDAEAITAYIQSFADADGVYAGTVEREVRHALLLFFYLSISWILRFSSCSSASLHTTFSGNSP